MVNEFGVPSEKKISVKPTCEILWKSNENSEKRCQLKKVTCFWVLKTTKRNDCVTSGIVEFNLYTYTMVLGCMKFVGKG